MCRIKRAFSFYDLIENLALMLGNVRAKCPQFSDPVRLGITIGLVYWKVSCMDRSRWSSALYPPFSSRKKRLNTIAIALPSGMLIKSLQLVINWLLCRNLLSFVM